MACTLDFRYLVGDQRNKRKRSNDEEEVKQLYLQDGSSTMDLDINNVPPPSKRPALPSIENPEKPLFGKPTYDGVIAGKVSSRKWKQPRERRSSATKISLKGTTFDQRAKEKEIKKAYKERKQEKKKQENILKSGTKLRKITNPKTLKKIAKSKQRKLLKIVPDNLLKK
ncbi:hypothetical protein AQUCO_01100088v1 [Aquilegia coerulea]|uniref:Coiled-coil domain-containing protein 86 n=1 Tax=Aquilegia coerulea TaxID=218851 RepID=A0A2G5E5J7_AQUCA|nr:hypothetical protein AQUCO_01100088v1 [Aquilegia coerulea]